MANKDKGKVGPKLKSAPVVKSKPGSEAVATKKAKAVVRGPQVRQCTSCYDVQHYQDRVYGPGKRLHTTGNAKNGYRQTCTRCGFQTK